MRMQEQSSVRKSCFGRAAGYSTALHHRGGQAILSTMLLVSLAASVHAEIYRFTDAEGNVEFSDKARKGAERVEVKETATIQLPKPDEVSAIIGERKEAVESGEPVSAYETLRIAYPESDTAFNSGSGDFSVIVDVTPDLQSSHQLRLTLDGQAQPLTRGPAIPLANVDRGSHSLSVDVMDGNKVVQSAQPVTFTLHRPSIRNRL